MFAQGGVGIDEDDALLLQVLAEAMVDNLRFVLRTDAGQELALGLGDAQLLKGVLDLGRDVLPGLALAIGGLHVVVNIVEIEVAEVAAPGRGRLLPEDVMRLQADVAHPLGLALHLRDLMDDLTVEPLAALERVVGLRIMKPILVVVLDAFHLTAQIGRHTCLPIS